MAGLVAYGSYVPYWRLARSAIADALGSGSGRGARSVASYDEDATSMGVEAARRALRAAPGFVPDAVLLATASPAYLEKTCATAVHAALGLPEAVAAYDLGGASRSAMGAIRMAASSDLASLVVCADVRNGWPGGQDEADGGDAAVALAFASTGPALADLVGAASSSEEFLDRWRTPGEGAARVWEERFGETVYVPLAHAALTDALKRAGVTAEAVDHLVVTGLHGRAARAFAASSGIGRDRIADDLTASLGNPGSAQPGLVLADVLDRAGPGQLIVVAHLADGADVLVLRTTDELAAYRQRRMTTVAAQLEAGGVELPYATFLTWRGMLHREPPRRPDPVAPAAPPSSRRHGWKFSFNASRCTACGTRHLPPERVCLGCRAVDQMVAERMADLRGTIATYTIDRLAFSPSPPVVAVVVDFDGGGRFGCELTDALPGEVAIGGRVAMTFRRLYTAPNGVHNYFWKARLVREGE